MRLGSLGGSAGLLLGVVIVSAVGSGHVVAVPDPMLDCLVLQLLTNSSSFEIVPEPVSHDKSSS